MAEFEKGVNPLSMERIVPGELAGDEATGAETLRLHTERYQFASQNLVPGRVLDIACGVGYGTAMLGKDPSITSALGVDLDEGSIRYARDKYSSDAVTFSCANALEFHSEAAFENIVSLETIEHVDDPASLFAHLVSLLAPGGHLIASVPITPSVDANPHHKTDFSKKSFLRLGDVNSLRYLTSLDQIQPFKPLAMATKSEARTANLRKNLLQYYFRYPKQFGLRLWSTMRDGFVNKYLTVVWQKVDFT
jgi:2-polyprenyl-3-methyl-5-hydroxy-6-metoxy-1,4-benzoquinol methylase